MRNSEVIHRFTLIKLGDISRSTLPCLGRDLSFGVFEMCRLLLHGSWGQFTLLSVPTYPWILHSMHHGHAPREKAVDGIDLLF